MRKVLVVVDVQNDFVDQALGTKEAVSIIPSVVEEIRKDYEKIFVTLDTHEANYMDTLEGKYLPVPHCIKGSEGWKLNRDVEEALNGRNALYIEKPTFGSFALVQHMTSVLPDEITLVGLCTDICVISNALLLRAALPNTKITVVEKACAGVTIEKHNAAIEVMRSCQIDIA